MFRPSVHPQLFQLRLQLTEENIDVGAGERGEKTYAAQAAGGSDKQALPP
jgi:hypothetical protein